MQEGKEKITEDILELGKLNELRILLTGLTQQELERLQKLIRDPHEFAEEMSELLPYSIRRLIEKGEISLDTLLPFVEDAMHKSIQKNPQKLADILFPVMGPAIRKAVSEDMKKLIASVNATLESGLSPTSLKWRLQAMFSKRSFTEIVLANTYVYHVSQVFLIHRQTGLLLHQEVANEKVEMEADMVSGMLTAIRDFVHDSFNSKESASLDEIQVGELKILVEQGPFAMVAAIVEGQPPADYRLTLMETVEAVHFNHAVDLEKFEGETDVFRHTSKFLKNCLIKQKKEKKSKIPWPLIILLILLIVVAGYFLYVRFEQNSRFNRFSKELEALPGYHLTNVEKIGKVLNIYGLRDLQSSSLDELMKKYQIDSTNLNLQFESYISLESEIVVKRAEELLQPPPTATFRYESGVLFFIGEASHNWLLNAFENRSKIWGVIKMDTTEMNVKEVEETQNLQWIIPEIEKYSFIFDMHIVEVNDFQQRQFDSLVRAAVFLTDYNKLYNKELAIFVRSYTNRSGNVEANLKVAIQRAEGFVGLLQQAGLPEDLLEAQVLFIEDLNEDIILRSVHFEVFDKNRKD